MKKIHLILLIIIVFHLFACRTELPAYEMTEAKQAISLAYEAGADKFAPELLKKASDNLYASHEACKENKTNDALSLAVSAKQNADTAAGNSWPLLSSESLKKAGDMYAQVKILDAQKRAPEEMLAASTKITEAKNENAAGSYRRSYLISQAAIQDIESARDVSLAAVSSLSAEIDELRGLISAIKEDPYAETYKADIASTEQLLNKAEKNIKNNNLKDASVQIINAREKTEGLMSSLLAAREEAQKAALAAAAKKQIQAAAAEKPAPKKEPAKEPAKVEKQIYIVKYYETNKDCLWRISQKVYNDPTLWPRIYMANRDKIKNPDLIFPGQRLVIPDIGTAISADKKAPQKKVKPKDTAKSGSAVSGKTKIQTDKSKAAAKDRSKEDEKGRVAEKAGQTERYDKTAADRDKTENKDGINGTAIERDSGGTGQTGGREMLLPDGIFRENQ